VAFANRAIGWTTDLISRSATVEADLKLQSEVECPARCANPILGTDMRRGAKAELPSRRA
jgi:hypothetical protein